jgi:type II secretory pathway pseudopilin PulG
MATGIIMALNPLAQLQKAQDAKRKSDLSQIQKSLETYYQDNGRYPVSTSNKITRLDGSTADWGTQWQSYMSVLPKDPNSSKNYVYLSSSTDGQTYYIYANLDRGGNDQQACFSTGAACSSAVTNNVSTACGGNCNYGVSSPNVSP